MVASQELPLVPGTSECDAKPSPDSLVASKTLHFHEAGPERFSFREDSAIPAEGESPGPGAGVGAGDSGPPWVVQALASAVRVDPSIEIRCRQGSV